MGFNGVLHTSSYYASEAINLDLTKERHEKSSLSILLSKEKELYNKLGVSSYQEFITELRKLFNGPDREVIKRFEANNLQKSLSQFALSNNYLFNEDVRFIFNFDNSKIDLAGLKLKSNAMISGEPIYLNFNPAEIREVLNRYFLYHNFKKGNTNWTKNLDGFISELVAKDILKIETQNASTSRFEEVVNINSIPNFPWGVTKKDIELAKELGKESEINQELQRACIHIKDYIFYTLGAGASQEMMSAISRVWQRNFSIKQNNPASFFSGGTKSNFISGVQGALGEFQTAVIFEFLAIKKMSDAFANIIGNTYKNGEQARTDVAIFNKLGIQVKNVSSFLSGDKMSLIRDLSTTMHPSKFAQYLSNGQSFLDFLANYYFNISYQGQNQSQIEAIKQWLGEYLGELMNMAMNDAVEDTVTFYMIGGQFLVPCSAILEKAQQLNLADNITITSAYKGMTDIGYRGSYTVINGKNRPEFVKYWNKKHSGWQPTEENTKQYNYLIGKGISIRTKFNLIDDIMSFSLF